jgi:hypothetical protein
MRRDQARPAVGSLTQLIALLAVAFMVTLGVVIGTRMSSDAIAVLVGVIAGVAASIPCALLLMAVTRRRESEFVEEREPVRQAGPPVIVVTPGASPQQQQLPQYAPYGLPAERPQNRRQFRVMGYEDDDAEAVEGSAQTVSWR